MNHKRRRPKHQRSGCLFCKPWKDERTSRPSPPAARRGEEAATSAIAESMDGVAAAPHLPVAWSSAGEDPYDGFLWDDDDDDDAYLLIQTAPGRLSAPLVDVARMR